MAAVRAASPRASRSGLPISAVMSCAICSVRASSASAALKKNAARWAAGSRDQPGNASAAAATAARASSAPDAA